MSKPKICQMATAVTNYCVISSFNWTLNQVEKLSWPVLKFLSRHPPRITEEKSAKLLTREQSVTHKKELGTYAVQANHMFPCSRRFSAATKKLPLSAILVTSVSIRQESLHLPSQRPQPITWPLCRIRYCPPATRPAFLSLVWLPSTHVYPTEPLILVKHKTQLNRSSFRCRDHLVKRKPSGVAIRKGVLNNETNFKTST
jgi:hypothetical protein